MATQATWAEQPAPGESQALAAVSDRLGLINPASPVDAGCWIDGACGWRATPRMITIAVERGWPITAPDARDLALWADPRHLDDAPRLGTDEHAALGTRIDEMARDALDWMNDNIAPDDYTFEWCDGDLMLWSVAESCAASGDRCYCVEPHDDQGRTHVRCTVCQHEYRRTAARTWELVAVSTRYVVCPDPAVLHRFEIIR